MSSNQFNEPQTRYNLIDPMIEKAGWNIADRRQVGFEVPVNGYDATPENGITDYCLFRANGDVIAVVEAKRTRRDARVGKQQVLDYVTGIEKRQSFRPFAFMTNGEDIFFWDTQESAERLVAGFFSLENLERLLHLKQNKLPLHTVKINESIVNRSYQAEAIRRIGEWIETKKKRKALLVMATGTGKTRTTMALIDVFLKARAAQRILFLADRDSLVDQALADGFKVHLPNESRERIRTFMFDDPKEHAKLMGARMLVSTIQTLELCYDKFTPADFDLIVTDECHRSIYNKFTDVLAYFDAVQVGLTATPAHFIDRNTFRFFECEGAAPTFLYTYDQAVKDGYLADYNVYAAQTKFQRKGVKGIDLSAEDQEQLKERGINPEDINFEGTDLERKVTNKDTLRRQWEEFMDMCHKDSTGALPAKSIVFAITHKHAIRLEETFNEMYPEHKGLLARVIDSQTERAKDLITYFKKEDLPRIAISVDMLDTGIDVPEVMNLAFMKPVNSQIKFWQMIGRGTRSFEACHNLQLLPGMMKDTFLIVDYWENFEHFNMMPKDDQAAKQIPVQVTIFNTRLQKLELLTGDQQGDDFKRVVTELRADIARIPTESFTVKKQLKDVREAWDDDFWTYINATKLEFLRMKVAPLLRFAQGSAPAQAFFMSKMERCGLMLLKAADLLKDAPVNLSVDLIESIKEDISLLPTNIQQVGEQNAIISETLKPDFWQQAGLKQVDEVKNALAPLMKYRRERPSMVIELGLDDVIESRKWVIVRKGAQKMMVEEYRKQVEEKIEELARVHPTLQMLKAGKEVKYDDLLALETTLKSEFGPDTLNLDEDNMLKTFGVRAVNFIDFARHLLKLEMLPTYELIVKRAFDAFILQHNYNADQTKFLRTVQTVFMQRRSLSEADLYDPPFSNFGMNAVEKLFSREEIQELIELTKKLIA